MSTLQGRCDCCGDEKTLHACTLSALVFICRECYELNTGEEPATDLLEKPAAVESPPLAVDTALSTRDTQPDMSAYYARVRRVSMGQD